MVAVDPYKFPFSGHEFLVDQVTVYSHVYGLPHLFLVEGQVGLQSIRGGEVLPAKLIRVLDPRLVARDNLQTRIYGLLLKATVHSGHLDLTSQ